MSLARADIRVNVCVVAKTTKYQDLILSALGKVPSALCDENEFMLFARAQELDDLVADQVEALRYLAEQVVRDASLTEQGFVDGNALSHSSTRAITERRVAIEERAKALRLLVQVVTGKKEIRS
ncbi:MAG TPA: hypothetical protein VFQ61_06420 [Polyangiaceae bacterium]|nr:hypothetical protein [Polyangiaceae bacterium]